MRFKSLQKVYVVNLNEKPVVSTARVMKETCDTVKVVWELPNTNSEPSIATIVDWLVFESIDAAKEYLEGWYKAALNEIGTLREAQ